MLVIAVVSSRSDRRDAIRSSWLAWGDERVELRFFTEIPAPRSDEEAALEEESAAHGDLVLMDIDAGMNFAVKLLWAMRWMNNHFTFEFFLRLDDDYFLCLRRLLNELSATLEVGVSPLNIYAGHMWYWSRAEGTTRIDEAYILLSADLVLRALATPDLMCAGHAGVTAGWWFTKGNALNQLGDVRWVHDARLDHVGRSVHARKKFGEMCIEHMGVHHAFPEVMPDMWDAAKDAPGPASGNPDEETSVFSYFDVDVNDGLWTNHFNRHHPQPCDAFVVDEPKMYCGKAGCEEGS